MLVSTVAQWVVLPPHSYRVPSLILSSGYCLCRISHIAGVGLIQVLHFPVCSQKHASTWTGESESSLSMIVCVHYAL